MNDNIQKRLFQGFVCPLILKMSADEGLFGTLILDELEQIGYRLSPGTLYPILRQMQQEGLLDSYEGSSAGKPRRYYTLTDKGRESLKESMEYLDFLTNFLTNESNKTAVS
ncbi:MAG: PadR family transcriptional regulator [Eubacteriales bacterium]|jgi:DNA-binding PadR family transcriptional regulator|nr:PadR family transcriptional regulator [Eubacteriales bacterium]MDD3198415.1 PadR family transcriptional regulator [Eubacteriales bacterium]MDD3504603.1 PadR family transcriptional regulator [Eubacteriales bacterium]MDD4683514.1 PadR family transcriptional regulator [Eubacteriales bacterium]